MADFLDAFKRHESSEGSIEEDEEEFNNQFVQGNFSQSLLLINLEELRHHSDDEEGHRARPKQQPGHSHYNNDERDQTGGNNQHRDYQSPNKDQQKKKDYYLYQGEEKPYESDPEEQGEGINGIKNEE